MGLSWVFVNKTDCDWTQWLLFKTIMLSCICIFCTLVNLIGLTCTNLLVGNCWFDNFEFFRILNQKKIQFVKSITIIRSKFFFINFTKKQKIVKFIFRKIYKKKTAFLNEQANTLARLFDRRKIPKNERTNVRIFSVRAHHSTTAIVSVAPQIHFLNSTINRTSTEMQSVLNFYIFWKCLLSSMLI